MVAWVAGCTQGPADRDMGPDHPTRAQPPAGTTAGEPAGSRQGQVHYPAEWATGPPTSNVQVPITHVPRHDDQPSLPPQPVESKASQVDPLVAAADLVHQLHDAVRIHDLNRVTALLELGANVNASGHRGLKALHVACREGSVDLVRLLIHHGAHINARDGHLGATPLHWAANEGHHPLVEYLITQGADVNAQDLVVGASPLFFAVGKGHARTAQLLRQHGGR